MESSQYLQVASLANPCCHESLFKLRLNREDNVDFSDYSCKDLADNDRAAQELFEQLQLLRMDNLKRFNGDQQKEIEQLNPSPVNFGNVGTSPLKLSQNENSSLRGKLLKSLNEGGTSYKREPMKSLTNTINEKELEIDKTMKCAMIRVDEVSTILSEESIKETSSKKSIEKSGSSWSSLPSSSDSVYQDSSKKKKLFIGIPHFNRETCESTVDSLQCLTSPYTAIHNPDFRRAPSSDTSTDILPYSTFSNHFPDKHTSDSIGIARPSYEFANNDYFASQFLPIVGFGTAIPRPLYGNKWGEPPDMIDYMWPEILSAIDEEGEEEEDCEEERSESDSLCLNSNDLNFDSGVCEDKFLEQRNEAIKCRGIGILQQEQPDASNMMCHVSTLGPKLVPSIDDSNETSNQSGSDDSFEEAQEQICPFFLSSCFSFLLSNHSSNMNRGQNIRGTT